MRGNLSSLVGKWARSHVGATALICLFVALAGVYLATAYSTFLSGDLWALLPWAVILFCPLMHLFLHWGHGHSHSQSGNTHTDHTGYAGHSVDAGAGAKGHTAGGAVRSGDHNR
jgi:hypothetical protein